MRMENSHASSSLPSLICEEDRSCFSESYENLCQCCMFEDDDDDYTEKLIHKESCLKSTVDHISPSVKTEQGWLKCARLDAVKWILDTRAAFGFQFQTVYLSLVYFDAFFSKRSIEEGKLWAIRLLSVACLSLAAKMEEYSAPALSEYQIDEYNFEASVIQKMEVLVLETLEWKMNLFTPFHYFRYFFAKFCGESRPKGLISRAIELTLSIVKEVNLVEFPPSIIAAAAVLAVSDCHITDKIMGSKMSVISSWGSSQKDHIFFCYNLIQEIQKADSNTPNPRSPMNLPIKQSKSNDCLQSSSTITSAVGPKRRLTYADSDETHPRKRFSDRSGM